MSLRLRATAVGTREQFSFDAPLGWVDGEYSQKWPMDLGGTPVEILLVQGVQDVERVTRAALAVMIGSMFVASGSLTAVNVMVVRSLARGIRTLSGAVQPAARGDLEREVVLPSSRITIGEGDDLNVLVDSFNGLVRELRDLHSDLEARVRTHDAGLRIATAVTSAVSSSLELDVILKGSAEILGKCLGDVCPGVHCVGVFLLDDDADSLVLAEMAGDGCVDSVRRRIRVPVGSNSPVGLAAANRTPATVQNANTASLLLKPPLRMDSLSAVAVPVLLDETLIGVLDVQSKHVGAFLPDSLPLLTTVANQIAAAVHNARLYREQCEVAERLAEADQLKTEFLAILSHKFRSPLSTISGLSKNLIEETESGLGGDHLRDVHLIHSLGQHLRDLTDGLFDFFRLSDGAITLSLEEVDIQLLIESALHTVRPLFENHPITVCAEIEAALHVLLADKRRLRQVLLGLLLTAASAVESGRIKVQARTIEALGFESEQVEPFVEVRIRSTGAERKGEGMFMAANALGWTGRLCMSSGCRASFGLQLTGVLLDLHGGRVWVDRGADGNAAFTFVVPVKPRSAPLEAGTPERILDTAGARPDVD